MAALFDDASILDHKDAVKFHDGRQAVGDGQHRLAVHGAGQGVLHLCLDLAVQGAGRLVQDQNGRILQEGAGQCDPLALAARQLDPAFAQMRVIARAPRMILQRQDEIMRLGGLGGRDDLILRGIGPPIKDVVAGRAVEHRGFLGDHGDLATQAFLRDVAQVVPVQQHRAAFDVVKPQQQRHQRRLAGPRGTDDADLFPGRDGQVQILDPALVPAIGKADVVKADPTLHPVQRDGIGGIGQPVRGRQGAHAVLDLADIAPHAHQRHADPSGHLRQAHGDGARCRDIAHRGRALTPQEDGAAHKDHRQNPRHDHQRQAEPGADDAEIQRAFAETSHGAQGDLILVPVMGEQLDGLDVGDGIDDLPRHIGPRRGPRPRFRPDAR